MFLNNKQLTRITCRNFGVGSVIVQIAQLKRTT